MRLTRRRDLKNVIDPAQANLFDSPEVAVEAHRALLTPDQIWNSIDAQSLVESHEDKRIERKPAQYSLEKLGQYISMWANTEPDGGIIVIGMTDGGVFEGLDSVGTSRLNRLEQVGLTFCPDATCNFKRVSVTNKANRPDFVLAIRVLYHQSRLVRTTKGMAFIRVGRFDPQTQVRRS